jgi:hypothetical protein
LTVPFAPDPISDALRRYYAHLADQAQANAPAAADATATRTPNLALTRGPGSTVGAAPTVAGPQLPTPLGHATELNPTRRTTPMDVLGLTGIPQAAQLGYRFGQQVDPNANLGRGAAPTQSDLLGGAGSLLTAAMYAMPGSAEARAAGDVAAPAAGMTLDQLSEWRNIQSFLKAQNAANTTERSSRAFLDARRGISPLLSDPYVRAGVEDMAIPATPKPTTTPKGNPDILALTDAMRAKSGGVNLPRVSAIDADKAKHMADVYAASVFGRHSHSEP